VNQIGILYPLKDAKELHPNLSFFLDGVRPQAVLNSRFAVSDEHADEVVQIAVRQPLDIQINGRAFDLEFRTANDVDFLLPNRQRLQRVVILLPFIAQPFGSATGPERVGKLDDAEYTFSVGVIFILRKLPRRDKPSS